MSTTDYDYSTDPEGRIRYVDVLISQDENPASPYYEEQEVVVALGDGIVVFDEDFDYDPRVYFYFDNDEQFIKAQLEVLEDVGFIILGVREDEE